MQEQNYSHKGWSSFLNQLSRNTGLSIFLLFLCINLSFGQHAISDTEKLASLSKLYGFLKYYHPEVAQGKFDWDQQVLDQIPKVLNASNKKDLSCIYLNWIEQLGLVEKCKKCKTKDSYFDKNFDLSWTQDPKLFTTELSSRLKYIENNRFQGEHFYIKPLPKGALSKFREIEIIRTGAVFEKNRALNVYSLYPTTPRKLERLSSIGSDVAFYTRLESTDDNILFYEKANYNGNYDGNGIPMLNYHGHIGLQYNPIAIAQWGLGNYNLWSETNENRYQIPDHDYNNPQTSINILNSNNDEDEVNNANIKEDTLINADDEVPVFGEDLEVPTYIRNRTIK